jgi:hypothetical protein
MLRFGMGLSLRVRVVLIVRDRSADVVLPLIDLFMFLLREVSAVRRTVSRNLVIDARLAVLNVPGLARSHLARPNALRNPILLVLRPRSNSRQSRILRTPAVH